MSFGSPNTSCSATWNMLPLMWVFWICLSFLDLFVLKQPLYDKGIFFKIELVALHGCTQPNINKNKWQHSTLQHRKHIKSAFLFNISHCFFQYILTSNIHINCLILWFTKAIVCCTGKCSCINPFDVCYSQHFSFVHHTSISLVPRPLFSPCDVWF